MVTYDRRAGVGVPNPPLQLSVRDGHVFWSFEHQGISGSLSVMLTNPAGTLDDVERLRTDFERFFRLATTSAEMRQVDEAYSQLGEKRAVIVAEMNSVVNRDEIYRRCRYCDRP